MMIKLKTILTEGFAWERKEGKGLPTLAEVQAEYEASHTGGSYESMTDSQLIAAADDAGMEEMVINGPDGLVNRDEIIKSLNDGDSHVREASGSKPDFLDLDGDGNEEESMKSVAADSTDYGNYVNKARAKSHLTKNNGSVYGIDGSGKGHKITSASGLDKYSKWTIKSESMNDGFVNKKGSGGWKREAENLMNVHRGSYDNSTLNDVIIDMTDAINYGIEDEDSLSSFIKKYDNTNESMNEGFVSRIKKNLIGGDLRK